VTVEERASKKPLQNIDCPTLFPATLFILIARAPFWSNMVPAIQFYYAPQSPPCRAVEMVAGMLGVELDKRPLDLQAGDHLEQDYIKLNPLHKVPFIVDGGLKMGESRAIMMYLVNKYQPNHPLYPTDPIKRAKVDELLFYEMGTLHEAQTALLRPKVFGGAKELDPELERTFRDCLHYLDSRVGDTGDTKFMTGGQLTIADILLLTTLDLAFDYSTVTSYDLSEFSDLLVYLERTRLAIPNYDEFNANHRENIRQFIRSTLGDN